MAGLHRLRYHVADDPDTDDSARPATTFRGPAAVGADQVPVFSSDEGAARFYLAELLDGDQRHAMRSVAPAGEPEQVAGLAFTDQRDLPVTRTTLVRFAQRHAEIPVFGAQALVELDGRRSLVAADVRVGDVPDIGAVPTIDAAQAIERVRAATGADVAGVSPTAATLEWFHDDDTSKWHLAWHVRDVSGLPAEARADGDAAGQRPMMGMGSRAWQERADYLVDAHTGEIVFYFGVSPTIGIPTKCSGTDEHGASVTFLGAEGGAGYQLYNPLSRVRTFDLTLGDLEKAAPPADAVSNPTALFGEDHRAAVTAHHYGGIVQDFYKRTLQRDGIDDKGMELISIVNCSCASDQTPPEWTNACWWKKRMWYGQTKAPDGRLRSIAAHLDVIAHEITHGVIETTSNLIYRDQSGALNESFADIFGIIIANREFADPDDVTTWTWQLGNGLGGGGGPLRDFANPASLGDPAHMSQYQPITADLGGVHIYSNIHNKAAHALLTTRDAQGGAQLLSVEDAALIFYLTLAHLPQRAVFSDAREQMLGVVKVFFSGDATQRLAVEQAVNDAYDSVGIQ